MTIKQTYTITLDDLLTPHGRDQLQAIFRDPQSFRAAQTTEQVTTEAAKKFALLADHLRGQGQARDLAARRDKTTRTRNDRPTDLRNLLSGFSEKIASSLSTPPWV